jgi:hypothetical protein
MKASLPLNRKFFQRVRLERSDTVGRGQGAHEMLEVLTRPVELKSAES